MRKLFILIVGLFILCGCVNDSPKPIEKKDSDFDYEVKAVYLKHGSLRLDAEVLVPKSKDKVPGVVIVPGSGATDMDGTAGKLIAYKEIAIGLAKQGIASIRFNKITYQHLSVVQTELSLSLDDEYFNDCRAAILQLRSQEEVDENKIYLIGHSMGAQIVPTLALEDNLIKGIILMGGTQMHLLDLLLEQVKPQDEQKYNEWLPYVQYVKTLTKVPAGEEGYFYFGGYSAYWVSYNQMHNRRDLDHVDIPVFILHGALDLQVSVDHFNAYKTELNNKSNIGYKRYDNLNHYFTNGENENLANAYQVYNEVSSSVILDIAQFIKPKN